MSSKPRFSSEILYLNAQDVNEEPSNYLSAYNQSLIISSSSTISIKSEKPIEENLNPKREQKKLTWGQDSYEGSVLCDNLHGSGFYFTQQNGEKFFYDGLFYVNKLEGYSQVFYQNGTHFQGLFQNHRRFGPGVLTYPNGTQDVGFWNGFHLSRLACVIGSESVPSLASSTAGKAKLLCTKYMVPLYQNKNDLVKQALDHGGVYEEKIDFSEVFNEKIRNVNSLFFHRRLFDHHFFAGKNCTIKVYDEDSNSPDDEEETFFDERANERLENLKSKIHEVNETLQTYIVIRQSLARRINKCEICCKHEGSEEYIEKSQEIIEPVILPSKSNDLTDIFPFDASLGDLGNIGKAVEDEEPKLSPSTTSTSTGVDACTCAEDENSVDLQNLEEQLQNISTEELFYRNIRDELRKKFDRLTQRLLNTQQNPKFKLVHVNDVWAWNNEEALIAMQKHAFQHRNSEDMVNFSIPSLILGNRKEFGSAGAHEEMCQRFLISCCKGKKDFVRESLRNNRIDPNLSDSRGNSGMFFASASNQQDIISILTNFGAKLDQFNDEQLTPLSMCCLKYIALKNNCQNWETSFLPGGKGCELPDLPKWYDIKSFQSMTTISSRTSTCLDHESNQQSISNLRIIDLLRKISNVEQMKGVLPRPISSTAYIFDLDCKNYKSQKHAQQLESNNNILLNLESIHLTIMTLLDYGANPNACEVPYPPLVLSLFTENPDLVKEVIKANADINVVIDDNVSCLHIAASLNPSLENINICRIIVKYGCNPNVKTSPSHWTDRKCGITGKLPDNFEIHDHGKNVLHLLCMRTDFEEDETNYFCAVAKLLLETNLDLNAMYLGHSPLSLAVLVGNIKLVQCLIKAGIFDPYKQLDYGMGNILTLFALKRFEHVLPLEKCKAMLTALFDLGLNVLNKVANSENVTTFVEDEDTFFDSFIPKAAKKEAKKPDKHFLGAVKDFLKSLGRQTIIKQVQMEVTHTLFEFAEEDMLDNSEMFVVLASVYLTPEIVLQNLKKLFEYRKIEHDRLDNDRIKMLLEFVNVHKRTIKTKSTKTLKKKPDQFEANEEVNIIDDMFREFDLSLNLHYVPRKYIPFPAGLDDPQKYKICFHCLKGKDKNLKMCPRCQMISFCSMQCNKVNLKLKTQHVCNILFYDMTDEEQAAISNGVVLRDLAHKVRDNCIARLGRMRESKLIEEERKLLEMWRADTYGTKFLQIKPLLDRAVTKKKDKQLNWDIGLLQGLLERNFQKSPGETSLYSLENLLLKLHGKEWYRILGKTKSEATLRTKQSWSTRRSTLGGSTLHSMIFQLPESEEKLGRKSCKCPKKMTRPKSKTKTKPQKHEEIIEKVDKEDDQHVSRFEALFSDQRIEENRPMIGKLKKIPARYQKFVEIIATYFPDIDISLWLLPYACCSGGQLFYKFCYNNDLFKESYSFT